MINFSQLDTILDMQNNMNSTINPEWATLNWDFMRASCLESAEAIEHHGWKWWKFQECDLAQLQMEIIDVWHFYLSHYLQSHGGDKALTLHSIRQDYEAQINKEVLFDGKLYNLSNIPLLEKIDLLVGLSAAKRTNINLFLNIANECKLTWSDIYKQYIMKNILNLFRQKHGYKQGTYLKEWFGREDNVWLVEEANKLDSTKPDFNIVLWDNLETVYLTNKANSMKS